MVNWLYLQKKRLSLVSKRKIVALWFGDSLCHVKISNKMLLPIINGRYC